MLGKSIMIAGFIAVLLIVINANGVSLKGKHQEGTVDADSLVSFAKSLEGTKYNYGSCSPDKGFDCSGFVYYVYSKFEITLPRSSYLMIDEGREVKLENARKGDLIFFTGTDAEVRKAGHVGIIISEKGQPVEFIHSSSGKKSSVVITPMSSAHYQKRFLKVKRLKEVK